MSTLKHIDLLNMDSVAVFLYDFILKTRSLSITFNYVLGDTDVANTVYWEANPQIDPSTLPIV